MNFLNIFEDRVSGIFGASQTPFSFKKLAKQAVREMEDQTLVINGANTAPALYTILVAGEDDQLMAPYYPQLSREVAEFVKAHAEKKKYAFIGEPLVRFMVDPSLKVGKFSVFAENIDRPTLVRLMEEERAFLQGIAPEPMGAARARNAAPAQEKQASAMPAAAQINQNMGAQIPSLTPLPADSFTSNADPFAPANPIPVPKTMTREQLAALNGAPAAASAAAQSAAASYAAASPAPVAGMGGAAAAAGVGGIAGVAAAAAVHEDASHIAPRAAAIPARPMAQLIDVVTGDTFDLASARVIVGRERAQAHVVLRDPNVSRTHAELTFNASDWTIEDLNSTNGTLVNNRRISRCPLRNGDMLTFGLSTFEFHA